MCNYYTFIVYLRMKLSNLLNQLFELSEFDTQDEILDAIKAKDKPDRNFLGRAFRGDSMAVQKLDMIFEALTTNLTETEFMKAIDLINEIKRNDPHHSRNTD